MPACRDCIHVDLEQKVCSLLREDYRRSVGRTCEQAMFLKHLPSMSGNVLEVGFGKTSSRRRSIQRKRGAVWYGVEPRWPTNEDLKHYKATVTNMPFENDLFDWVICFSSIEHWREYGDGLEEGIQEIARVLKSGGKMLIGVPMCYHGDDVFYYGDLDTTKKLFAREVWDSVEYDDWRRVHEPLAPMQKWHEDRRAVGVNPLFPTWYLEVFATKA